ncbi:hypothetical protein HNQ50_000365 [Silvimonas terrae]|uniref:Uncharacterized protein n=1 Tax=Silvimonas terrae TaxID=300266 RepID=A0A840R8K6_9NEIS|nr:hypothetical protein [Silvimonas terrae]MBB5189655.1 hypothetical protein [Silvimonas terrae]
MQTTQPRIPVFGSIRATGYSFPLSLRWDEHTAQPVLALEEA